MKELLQELDEIFELVFMEIGCTPEFPLDFCCQMEWQKDGSHTVGSRGYPWHICEDKPRSSDDKDGYVLVPFCTKDEFRLPKLATELLLAVATSNQVFVPKTFGFTKQMLKDMLKHMAKKPIRSTITHVLVPETIIFPETFMDIKFIPTKHLTDDVLAINARTKDAFVCVERCGEFGLAVLDSSRVLRGNLVNNQRYHQSLQFIY